MVWNCSDGHSSGSFIRLLWFSFAIDDEPDDEGSPQHYILIHGILTAPVIHYLSEIGVHVDALICVKAQIYESLTPAPEQQGETKDTEDEAAIVRSLLIIMADKLHKCRAKWSKSCELIVDSSEQKKHNSQCLSFLCHQQTIMNILTTFVLNKEKFTVP